MFSFAGQTLRRAQGDIVKGVDMLSECEDSSCNNELSPRIALCAFGLIECSGDAIAA